MTSAKRRNQRAELEYALANVARLVTPETPARAAYLNSVAALGASAHAYAAAKWPVFPIAPGGKTPIVANGFMAATTDTATVDQWWARWPDANIGVPTGVRFDVIDIDPPTGFVTYDTYRERLRTRGSTHPPILAVSFTGSGGRHMLIAVQPDARNGVNFGPGLDYRTRGGYIIVPPSRLRGAARYRWVIPPDDRLLAAT